MTRVSKMVAAIGLCAVALASSPASADNGDWRGAVNGWIFKPAVVNQHVVGFIGWVDTATVVGDNISTIWLERGANDSWTTWAWKSGSFAKAVDSIRTTLAQPALFNDQCEVEAKLASLPLPTEPESPTALAYGLFEDDAVLQSVAESSDPVQVVAALSDVGWASAPTISALSAQKELAITGQNCDPLSAETWTIDQLANNMADAVEMSMFASSSVANAKVCRVGICIGCWGFAGPAGAWGGWTCTGSTTTPAGVIVCSYARTRTRTRTYSGALFWGCGACPAPITETQTETGVIRLTSGSGTCDCSGAAVPVSTGTGSWI